MTEAEMKRALNTAVCTAYRLGHSQQGKPAGQQQALRFAEALVLPIHEMCIQQGIEEAFNAARQAQPEASHLTRQAGAP